MREIKFRALKDDMSNCNFVYGNLIYDNDVPRIQSSNKELLFHTCLKGTEGQYTGLKDANGLEIYEGDILHSKTWGANTSTKKSANHVVRWSKCGWVASGYNGMIQVNPSLDVKSDFVIVGNIHTTPELI